jgi:SAM-dependent methyltransferase
MKKAAMRPFAFQARYHAAMNCPLCQHSDTPLFAEAGQRRYFRCSRCELTFLDPAQRPDAQTERAYYDLHQNSPDDPGYRAFLNRLAQPLSALLPANSHGLDFGCGPGPALARMLEEQGHRMALYDPIFAPNENALQQRYDVVTCTEVVEHFHQPQREFARFNTLVKPGGLLAVMTGMLDDQIDFARWHYRRDPTHVCFYRQATFAWWAQRYGWQRERECGDVVIMRQCGH